MTWETKWKMLSRKFAMRRAAQLVLLPRSGGGGLSASIAV